MKTVSPANLSTASRRAGRRDWCLDRSIISESRLNPFCEGAEVTYPLHFVIGEFDVEMIFEPRQQLQRLQRINAQFLKEVIVGRELFARGLEMGRREVEDFINGLIRHAHEIYSEINVPCVHSQSIPLNKPTAPAR